MQRGVGLLLATVVVLVIGAGAAGYVIGTDQADDDQLSTSLADCPVVQVPVSDHIEGLCLPEAAPLFELFDEPSTPPGSSAEGWSLIGEVWLSQGNDIMDVDRKGLCWVNATDETRCTSP